MSTITHILDNQEVIKSLQSEAIEIHKQHVFMLNNKPDHIDYDWHEADIDYQYVLGSIEHQINQLFT